MHPKCRQSAETPGQDLPTLNSTYITELENGLNAHANTPLLPERAPVAVILRDPLACRLLESAAAQLDLVIELLPGPPEDLDTLVRFELVIADESTATALLAARHTDSEALKPAIVAVRTPSVAPALTTPQDSSTAPAEQAAPAFDGILILPLTPAAIAAQLSLVLYAHRAFASRYQSALEELHLNRRIFRSVTSGISVSNASLPDLPLVYVNPAFEVMTGYCLEDVQGKNCRFLQGDERDQEAVTLLRNAIREQREVVAILRNFRKDGSAFWNELSLSPIFNREGRLTHFVGIQTDITARVEFEAALRESEKLAAVGRLASSIAHEINNPLEAVMNLLYLAQQTDDAEESRRYVRQADKEVQRVALITSQSLRFYKQSTRAQPILAHDLLESVLDLYEARMLNSGVTLLRRERSLRPIACLESEIRQVLNNLVRNSIDAMHASGGRLLIRTRDVTLPVPGVLITVADTGSGISPQALRQIYKPFFTTKGIAGTGLGLWISSEIIARHRGSLRVRSRQTPGASGTVFQLFLPAEPA